jgi:hypothetical protein
VSEPEHLVIASDGDEIESLRDIPGVVNVARDGREALDPARGPRPIPARQGRAGRRSVK